MITPSIATFLITLINIGILFFVLRAILFKPVTKFMAGRTQKIEDTMAQAEKDKAQAKALLLQYEDQLRRAEGEAAGIIREARETAQQQADRIIEEGKAQADILLANARKQTAAEQQAALALFRAEAASLVIAASSRLLQRDLNQEDNRRFAALLLKEMAAQQAAATKGIN